MFIFFPELNKSKKDRKIKNEFYHEIKVMKESNVLLKVGRSNMSKLGFKEESRVFWILKDDYPVIK